LSSLIGLRSDEIVQGERWNEDTATVSSDPGSGFAPDCHGSFDELPSTTSSISSIDLGEPMNDTLNRAQVARLSNEEAGAYLKSVLNVTPTNETSYATTAGDARADSISITHGTPWIPVTHRHSTMHVKVKPGRPTTDGGRADHNWPINSGLYNARLWKSFRSVSAPTPTNKKKKSYNIKPTNVQHRERGMPAYLVKELDELDTTQFEIALNYWMDDANFIGYPTTMVPYAYDEAIYPNAQFKPTGRHGRRHRRVNVPIQRNQALSSLVVLLSNTSSTSAFLLKSHKQPTRVQSIKSTRWVRITITVSNSTTSANFSLTSLPKHTGMSSI
jgi:hypothetical protein